MLSSFLTNFCCISEAGRLLLAATSFLKASISGGRGGGEPQGPLLGPWQYNINLTKDFLHAFDKYTPH
jgi:hypothetical protein